MLPRRPGPSSTTRGAPVSRTGSPGRTPLVSSYTWMIVFSPAIWMTPPISCSPPTNITSYMRGRSPVAVTTGPATRKISPVPFAWTASIAFIAMSLASLESGSLVQVDPDRPLDLRAEVLLLALPDRDHDGAGRRLEAPPHRVAQRPHVLPVQDEDPDRRGLEALRDLRLQALPRRDHPQVLDLPLLPDDVVENREHGQRVHVGVPARAQEVELLDGPHELAHAEGLQVLQAARELLRQPVLPQAGGDGRPGP